MANSSFIVAARGIIQRQSTLVKSASGAASAMTAATGGAIRTSSSYGGLAAGTGATITVAAVVTQLYSSYFNTTTLASAHSSLRQDYNLSTRYWGFSKSFL